MKTVCTGVAILIITLALLALGVRGAQASGPPAVRGDANFDGTLNLVDPIVTLHFLFAGLPHSCPLVMDTDFDGDVDVADVMFILSYLFEGGPAPTPPFFPCP